MYTVDPNGSVVRNKIENMGQIGFVIFALATLVSACATDVAPEVASLSSVSVAGLASLGQRHTIRTKGTGVDLVTEVDLASETLILSRLSAAFPGDAILAEDIPAALVRLRADALRGADRADRVSEAMRARGLRAEFSVTG